MRIFVLERCSYPDIARESNYEDISANRVETHKKCEVTLNGFSKYQSGRSFYVEQVGGGRLGVGFVIRERSIRTIQESR
jgi:hypothetical protein